MRIGKGFLLLAVSISVRSDEIKINVTKLFFCKKKKNESTYAQIDQLFSHLLLQALLFQLLSIYLL